MSADLQIYAPQKLWRTQLVNRLGVANLAANATEGFFYLPEGAGPPTGTPDQAPAGFVPTYWDHTDQKLYIYDGGWVIVNPTPAPPPPQNYLQTVSFETGAVATGTTSIPFDDTIPQNTEGDQYMSLSITPQFATSNLRIEVTFVGSLNVIGDIIVSLFRDAAVNALATGVAYSHDGTGRRTVTFSCIAPATAAALTTFKVRAGGGSNSPGTVTFNGYSSGRLFGGNCASSITIAEVAP